MKNFNKLKIGTKFIFDANPIANFNPEDIRLVIDNTHYQNLVTKCTYKLSSIQHDIIIIKQTDRYIIKI